MLRDYRRFILATCWLILCASAPAPNWQIEQSKAEQRQADALEQLSATVGQKAKPEKQDNGCPKGPEDRSSDLCAQWKAADAASEAAIWTRKTYYLVAREKLCGARKSVNLGGIEVTLFARFCGFAVESLRFCTGGHAASSP